METIKIIIGILASILLFYLVVYATFEVIDSVMNFFHNWRMWREWTKED